MWQSCVSSVRFSAVDDAFMKFIRYGCRGRSPIDRRNSALRGLLVCVTLNLTHCPQICVHMSHIFYYYYVTILISLREKQINVFQFPGKTRSLYASRVVVVVGVTWMDYALRFLFAVFVCSFLYLHRFRLCSFFFGYIGWICGSAYATVNFVGFARHDWVCAGTSMNSRDEREYYVRSFGAFNDLSIRPRRQRRTAAMPSISTLITAWLV